MRIPRIYQDTFLSVGDSITLDTQATVHVSKVLRLRLNDAVTVFNGRGGEYHGRIVSQEKRSTLIVLESFDERSVESLLSITLAQGISRGERMDYTVQKAVELGVNHIAPLVTKRTGVNLDGDRKQRRQLHWQAIVQAACEQSGRNRVPAVAAIQNVGNYLDGLSQSAPHACKLVLSHRAGHGITSDVSDSNDINNIILLIGPEGGLAETELDAAEYCGFTPVRLGPRVMRTETAALVALAVLQSQWGDLRR